MRLESRRSVGAPPSPVGPVFSWDVAGKAEQSRASGSDDTASRRVTKWNRCLTFAIIVFQAFTGDQHNIVRFAQDTDGEREVHVTVIEWCAASGIGKEAGEMQDAAARRASRIGPSRALLQE